VWGNSGLRRRQSDRRVLSAGLWPLSLRSQFEYLGLTCVAIGFELVVIIGAAYLSVWGPGLALRGQAGSVDLHRAVFFWRVMFIVSSDPVECGVSGDSRFRGDAGTFVRLA